MKKYLLLIPLAFFFSFVPPTEAAAYKDGFSYVVFKNEQGAKEVRITYGERKPNIVIPAKLGGYPVTEIGSQAFAFDYDEGGDPPASGVTITLPKTIKKVGAYAFDGLGIASVNLPEGLEEIGDYTFSDLYMNKVKIPSSLTKIGINIFSTSRDLKIQSPQNPTPKETFTFEQIQYTIFEQNDQSQIEITGYEFTPTVNTYTVPESINGLPVTKIGDFAFTKTFTLYGDKLQYQTPLITVELPNSIESIGRFAFAQNEKSSGGVIMNTLPTQLKVINDYAFYGNHTLNKNTFTIPENVISIGKYAFSNSTIKNLKISDSLKVIGERAFYKAKLSSKLTIPKDLVVEDGAFQNNNIPSVSFEDGITSIPANLFANNQIKTIALPKSVTKIEDGAFSSNTLTSVNLSNNVIKIGRGAFSSNKLKSFTIPNKLTKLEPFMLHENLLGSIKIPSSVTAIGDDAFGWNKLTSVTIPNSVTSIGESAFDYNELKTVTLSKNLTYLGEQAFNDNEISFITIPAKLQTIPKFAFADNKLKSVVIPKTIKMIEIGAFTANQLTSITIKFGTKTIGQNAFSGNKLTTLSLPDSVTSVGLQAFSNNQLQTVKLSNNLTSIRRATFSNNKITSISLPSKMTAIHAHAFFNNKLTKLTLPNNMKTFDSSAIHMNPLRTIKISGKKTIVTKRIPSPTSYLYPLATNTKSLQNFYINSQRTIPFTKWDKVQLKPVTLYTKWK